MDSNFLEPLQHMQGHGVQTMACILSLHGQCVSLPGCHNISQTRWFKIIEIHPLPEAEACWQGHAPLKPVEQPFLASFLLLVVGQQSLSFLSLQLHNSPLCLCVHWQSSSLSLSHVTWPSYTDTRHIGLGPMLLQYDLFWLN